MVQVDLPAAVAVGQGFALLTTDYLKREASLATNRLLGPLNLYLVCGLAPAGLYLLVGWPAWELMYVTGWFENPFDRPLAAAAYVVFVMAMVVLGNASFMAAHSLIQRGRERAVRWATVIALLLTVLPFGVRWGVWLQVGTFDQIKASAGYSFWSAPFFPGWVCVMSYLALTTVAFGIWLRKVGNRMSPAVAVPGAPEPALGRSGPP